MAKIDEAAVQTLLRGAWQADIRLYEPLKQAIDFIKLAEEIEDRVVITTDDVTQTVFTIPIKANTMWFGQVIVCAIEEGGASRRCRSVRLVTAWADPQGAVTIDDPTYAPVPDLLVPGWGVTIEASGGDVLVKVSGEAGTRICWTCSESPRPS